MERTALTLQSTAKRTAQQVNVLRCLPCEVQLDMLAMSYEPVTILVVQPRMRSGFGCLMLLQVAPCTPNMKYNETI